VSPAAGLSLKILSPEGVILNAHELSGVNVPLVDGGSIGIKPGHAPLIAETIDGMVQYLIGIEERTIEVHAGVLDIKNNVVTILTAGKVTETPPEINRKTETGYDRLIQTLVENLYPEEDNPES
jgi:F0F1-type ATP synthase epsilon subunit